jgi:hypothetical protein
MELNRIASVLKEYECYCYQIAYYLLEHEEGARQAASQALLELGRTRSFRSESAEARRCRAKKVTMKIALGIRR